MKIRSDFVTNSSSSSFVTIHLSGGKLTEILNQYSEWLEGIAGVLIISEDTFLYHPDEGWADVPVNKDEILSAFLSFVEKLCEDGDLSDEQADELSATLKANEKEILETIKEVEWDCSEGSYGEFTSDGDVHTSGQTFTYKDGKASYEEVVDEADDGEFDGEDEE